MYPSGCARSLALALAALQLAGCMTLGPVPPADGAGVAHGDDIRIVTSGGREPRLRVDRAHPEFICSAKECVGSSEIAIPERMQLDPWRTALNFAVVLWMVALVRTAVAVPLH